MSLPLRSGGRGPYMPLSHKECNLVAVSLQTMIAFDRRLPLPAKRSDLPWPSPNDELGRLRNRCGLEPVWGVHGVRVGYSAATKGESWAVHAEPGEVLGHAYSKAPIVTGQSSRISSARLVSADIKEAGLWLWQGELPPSPPSLRRPKYSRPAISSSHRTCCGMGWLDSGACGFGPGVSRGINDAAPGSASISGYARRRALTIPVAHRYASDRPRPPSRSSRTLHWIRRIPCAPSAAKFGTRARTASDERACTTQIIANWGKGSMHRTFAKGRYSRCMECSRHRS